MTISILHHQLQNYRIDFSGVNDVPKFQFKCSDIGLLKMKKSDRLSSTINCRRVQQQQALNTDRMVAKYRPLLANVSAPGKKRLSDGLINAHSIRAKVSKSSDVPPITTATATTTNAKKLNFQPIEPYPKSASFEWTSYLKDVNADPVQPTLFHHVPFTVQVPLHPVPARQQTCPAVNFKPGHYLEGIDPFNESLFCVLSVVEVLGRRLKLHFVEYPEKYDFWTSVDSPFLFPTGWCSHNGRQLQPPKDYLDQSLNFNWSQFLNKTAGLSVSRHAFKTVWDCPMTNTPPHQFGIGLKLEAVDKRNPTLASVATVKDCIGDYVLIHFDGWDVGFDQWVHISSELLHCAGYCEQHNQILSIPSDWNNGTDGFNWSQYLKDTNSKSVSKEAFEQASKLTKSSKQFLIHQRLEAVDKRCPSLIRVANVVDNDLPGFLTIGYDGWSEKYNVRVETNSLDLFPVGYCHTTGYVLQVPAGYDSDLESNGSWHHDTNSNLSTTSSNGNVPSGGCPTVGCKGYGHIKGPRYYSHQRLSGCPYADINLKKDAIRPHERLSTTHIVTSDSAEILTMSSNSLDSSSVHPGHHHHQHHRLSPDSTVKSGEGVLSSSVSPAPNDSVNPSSNADEEDDDEPDDDEEEEEEEEEEEDQEEQDREGCVNQLEDLSQSKYGVYQSHSLFPLSVTDQFKLKLVQAHSAVMNNLFMPGSLATAMTTTTPVSSALSSSSSSSSNEACPLNLSLDKRQDDVKDLTVGVNIQQQHSKGLNGVVYPKNSNMQQEPDHGSLLNSYNYFNRSLHMTNNHFKNSSPHLTDQAGGSVQNLSLTSSKLPTDLILGLDHSLPLFGINQTSAPSQLFGDYDKPTHFTISTLPVKRKRGRPRKYTSSHMYHSSSGLNANFNASGVHMASSGAQFVNYSALSNSVVPLLSTGCHSFPIGLTNTLNNLMCAVSSSIHTSLMTPSATANNSKSASTLNGLFHDHPTDTVVGSSKHHPSASSPSESATSVSVSPKSEMDCATMSTTIPTTNSSFYSNSSVTSTTTTATSSTNGLTHVANNFLSFMNNLDPKFTQDSSLLGLHIPTDHCSPMIAGHPTENASGASTTILRPNQWYSESLNRHLMSLNPMCLSASSQWVSDWGNLTNSLLPPLDFLSRRCSAGSALASPAATTAASKEVDLMGKLLPQAGAALQAAKVAGFPGPQSWTPTVVANFVATLPGCKQFANKFVENEIDGAALLCLEQHDLMQILGMKLGPAVKVSSAIQTMRQSVLATPWSELGTEHQNAMQAAASCFDPLSSNSSTTTTTISNASVSSPISPTECAS